MRGGGLSTTGRGEETGRGGRTKIAASRKDRVQPGTTSPEREEADDVGLLSPQRRDFDRPTFRNSSGRNGLAWTDNGEDR